MKKYISGEGLGSIREGKDPKKTIKAYKLMRLVDGNLYPLFIDSSVPIEIGVWYDADSPDLSSLKDKEAGFYYLMNNDNEVITSQKKKPKKEDVLRVTERGLRYMFIEETERKQKRFGDNRKYWNVGINGSGGVSFFSLRPGWHAGSLPTMRQIGKGKEKNLRDDSFVWTEVELSADKDYNAEAQRNPDKDIPDHIPTDGYYMKATNADKTKSQADLVGWYVAGAMKIVRIIGDLEARQIIDDFNAKHPRQKKVEYDYDRESGKVFSVERGLEGALDIKDVVDNYEYTVSAHPNSLSVEFKGKTLTVLKYRNLTKSSQSRDRNILAEYLHKKGLFKYWTSFNVVYNGIDFYIVLSNHLFSVDKISAYFQNMEAVQKTETKELYNGYEIISHLGDSTFTVFKDNKGYLINFLSIDDAKEFIDKKNVATPSKEKSFSEIVSSLLDDGFKLNQKKIDAVANQCGISNANEMIQLAELGVVLSARRIAQSGEALRVRYEKILDLYDHQPTISPKDGKARFLQQFSTTAPLALLAGEFVKGAKKTKDHQNKYLEPTAGNGMLTIALPTNEVWVNELDEIRYKNLMKQGFAKVGNGDATKMAANPNFKGVITNPPFADLNKEEYIKKSGKKGDKEITYTFKTLDHKLAVMALDSMADNGRAAIIIGGKLASKVYDHRKAYWNEDGYLVGEFNSLISYINRQYNLVDILYIDGELYAKQGTTYPLVMLLVDGRKQWDPTPTAIWHKYDEEKDKTISSYTEYWDRMFGHIDGKRTEPNISDVDRKRKLLLLAQAKIKIAKAKAGLIVKIESLNGIDEMNRETLYKMLLNNTNYYGIVFNRETGGLIAIHNGHRIDKLGGVSEINVLHAALKTGHIAILEDETDFYSDETHTEGLWDGKPFEIAGKILDKVTDNSIKRGLKHCADKYYTKIAIIDYQIDEFDINVFLNGLSKYKGLKKLKCVKKNGNPEYIKFERVIVIQNRNIVYDEPFVE